MTVSESKPLNIKVTVKHFVSDLQYTQYIKLSLYNPMQNYTEKRKCPLNSTTQTTDEPPYKSMWISQCVKMNLTLGQ